MRRESSRTGSIHELSDCVFEFPMVQDVWGFSVNWTV